MTVTSTYSPIQYTGNGVTTAFAFPYLFYANSEIVPSIYDSSTGLTTTPATTITGAGNPSGGTVTASVAPTSTQTLTIQRIAPFTQTTDYEPYSPLPPASIERNLDELTFQTQQLNVSVLNAIRAPNTDTNPNMILPSAVIRAGFYLAFDSNGNPTLATQGGSIVPLTGTSTTSLLIGVGSKSLTTQTGLGFIPGGFIVIAYSSILTDYMFGQITSYNSSTGALVVSVTSVGGSGTFASWNLQVSGPAFNQSIANNTVLGNNSGSTAAATALTASQVLAMISSTQGTLLYNNGTNWVALSPGTSGQYLKTLGASANPTWATLPTIGYFSKAFFTNTSNTNPTISGGVNITSITRSGTGSYTVVMASSAPNAFYTVVGTAGYSVHTDIFVGNVVIGNATTFTFQVWSSGGVNYDPDSIAIAVFA